jgi:hypothetical protein
MDWPKFESMNKVVMRTTSVLRRCVLMLAALLVLAPYTAAQQSHPLPRNEFLANSPWPMSHRHPFNQGSSPFKGPTTASDALPDTISGSPVPITLAISDAYPDGRRAIWGTTMKYIFKLDANQERMEYFAKFAREQTKEDAISGAYSVLDRDGFYFVPRGSMIESFRDAVPGDPASHITKTHEFTLAGDISLDDEMIVGINLTFDGRIVFVTNKGLLGSLSRELDDFESLRLTNADESEVEVSNSLAVDDEGRIIVVTSQFVTSVLWNPTATNRLATEWKVAYSSDDIQMNGRLGSGSGTTPSLLGWGDEDKLVAICDGRELMNLVLIWRAEIPSDWKGLPGRDRRIAAEVPVKFGDDQATRSTTEQSLTVSGHEIAAVSNLYGDLKPLMKRFVRRRMGNDINNMTIYRSNSSTIAPYGIQRFTWNQEQNELTSVWVRTDLSCPNGIPTMSEATGLMYFIGQREEHWTLEAVDWATGEDAFHCKLSKNSDQNSFYAATQIGLDQTIITGTYGGVLRFNKVQRPCDTVKANATDNSVSKTGEAAGG